MIVICVSSISAKSLKEYKENIKHIKDDFVSIIRDEWKSSDDKTRFEDEISDEVKKLLPPEDLVEIGGKTIEINNQWLTKKIEDYKNENKNLDRKSLILSEIYERLEAIELQIDSLEKANATGKTKDENKRKVSEILSREEYQKPSKDDESLIQKIFKQLQEWWSWMFPKPQIQPYTGTSFKSVAYFLQFLLYALIIGAIGFLLYKFGPYLLERFRRSRESKSGETIILGERLSADATSKTLFSEAERLANEGDLKAAIRKGYIALLFELSDRKVLGLAKHKTNRDYLWDVRKRQELHQNMSGLTSNYEKHWYGFEKVETSDWEDFRSRYNEAMIAIR